MNRSYLRYFIGFFITIVLIIILIVLLFGGGGDKKQTANGSKAPKKLSDLAQTDDQVRMTIAGNVRATQLYKEVQITSDRNQNNINIINGYQGNVVKSQNYSNNQEGYETFLRSLSLAGFKNGDKSKLLADDRGFCPLGQRYIFEIIENSKVIQRYWSSSCGKSVPRTYLGSTSLTTTLFQHQIPDYDELTDDIDY